MWRRLFCALAFLASLYCLSGAAQCGWLTAADSAQAEPHRMWCYVWLVVALLCYAGFGVLLRPRSVLHFVLCSLAVPAAIISAMAVQYQGWCTVWPALLVIACGYLLWRVWVVMNPK
jgi:hypothetical protein